MKLLSNIYTKLHIGYITIYSNSRSNSLDHIHSALLRVGLGKFKTEVIHTDDPEMEGTIAARRFNIGNFGKYSVVILEGIDTLRYGIDYSAFKNFADELLNIASFDSSPEIIISCNREERVQDTPVYFQRAFAPEHSSNSESFFSKLKSKINNLLLSKGDLEEPKTCDYDSAPIEKSENHLEPETCDYFPAPIKGCENYLKAESCSFNLAYAEKSEKDLEEQEEEYLVNKVELDKKTYLDRISAIVLDYVTRFNEMPPIEQLEEILRGKLSIASNKLSPITVNNDLKVILPAYNELELRFSPILRTIYILFLCHPEGIILKQIGNYRNEIENIYLLIKPGGDDNRMKQTIDDLCDPFSDSLRQKLSKINRIVKNSIINPELSTRYIIDGSKGEAYKISLDNTQITMPKCLN